MYTKHAELKKRGVSIGVAAESHLWSARQLHFMAADNFGYMDA
jgi:hypothetical protein